MEPSRDRHCHLLEWVSIACLLYGAEDLFVDTEGDGDSEHGQREVGEDTEHREHGEGEQQHHRTGKHQTRLLDVTPEHQVQHCQQITTMMSLHCRSIRDQLILPNTSHRGTTEWKMSKIRGACVCARAFEQGHLYIDAR